MRTNPINKMWEGYRRMVLPKDAPSVQIVETQRAFFAGALVLYEYIMTSLEPGTEPTDADLEKMAVIDCELRAFGKGFDAEVLQPTQRQTS